MGIKSGPEYFNIKDKKILGLFAEPSISYKEWTNWDDFLDRRN